MLNPGAQPLPGCPQPPAKGAENEVNQRASLVIGALNFGEVMKWLVDNGPKDNAGPASEIQSKEEVWKPMIPLEMVHLDRSLVIFISWMATWLSCREAAVSATLMGKHQSLTSASHL